jgi:ATP-binding cassette, subfamily B, bacterial
MTDIALDEDEAEALTPRARRANALKNSQIMAYVARQWRRRPVMGTVMAAMAVAATLFDIAIPVFAGRLVDAVTAGEGRSPWPDFWIMLGLAALTYAFRQVVSRLEIRFSVGNMEALTKESFTRVQTFSADWHANTFAGATVRKITRGMWAYDTITATLVFGSIPTLVMLVGMPLYMMTVWPMVGGFAFAVTVLFVIGVAALQVYYIKPANLESARRDSAIGAALADSIGNGPTVKSFGAEAREDARFSGVMRAWAVAGSRSWNRHADVSLIVSALMLLLLGGVIGLLLRGWEAGTTTAGDLAFAASAFFMMSGYMRRFGDEVRQLQRGLDDIEDIVRYDRTPPQVADATLAAVFAPGRGEIEFDRVTFAYGGQDEPLYRDFSLRIAPGERVALVGATGSGKSTFVKLIQRLYDVQAGAVLVDGQDVREVEQSSLRACIALVPQDPALFHRSIAENIAYGSPGADHAAIEAAARRARAHDFIARLPKGYGTLVGERGVKLSGGERQRVAIARALLADAPILVLDEATSSLDTATEREVQAAMDEVMKGRTTILIAHRLSTIRSADRILVFDRGRIVEQGRHGDLMRTGGVYARLHELAEEAA